MGDIGIIAGILSDGGPASAVFKLKFFNFKDRSLAVWKADLRLLLAFAGQQRMAGRRSCSCGAGSCCETAAKR